MGRFLVGVLFALALFWGYETFWRGGAQAGEQPATEPALDQFAETATGGGEVPFVTADGPAGALPDGNVGGATRDEGELGALAAAVREGDPAARAEAFGELARLEGRSRDPLAAAIVAAARGAESTQEQFALLGADNAFLHSEEGRQLAARLLESIAANSDRQAQLADLTRLLELCMNGSIEQSQAAARSAVDRIRERHRIVARQVAFDPRNVAGAKRHVVQRGESLDRIAARVRTQLGVPMEAGTIAVFNRISNPNVLRADQELKIPLDPIRTVVCKRSFLVAVYCGPTIVRTYWCAHGRAGHDTPEATFKVVAKIEKPDWHYEGRVIPYGHPDNPLGTHFVKFEHPAYSGFGVHGTTEPESIGTCASLGCIRLGAEEIVDYFHLVPRGTEVEIRP